jgi:hypothetical protein
MILDGPMGQLAATLTGQFGRPATLRRPGSGGSYSPTTGTITGGAAEGNYPCSVVFEEFGEGQIDGTLVQLGDRKAIVARQTLGVEPVPQSDTLLEGGRTWQIVRVMGYSSGAQEAAYSLHVRR